MTALTEKTTVPLFAGLRGVWTVVALLGAATAGTLAIREDVMSKISSGNTTTAAGLARIDEKISGLTHRLDLFEQRVTLHGLITKDQLRLWVTKAKQTYKDLPDVE